MNVYLDSGQRLTLDNQYVIGSGGEGTVFRLPSDPNIVYKIYENPTTDQDLKLRAFLQKNFNLSNLVAAPKFLVLNGRNKVIGFSMPFFGGTKAIRELANRKYRNTMSVDNRIVSNIMVGAARELKNIHQQGLIIGDLNDLNVLFDSSDVRFIDVDSWQFDQWPCPVATENYLDPALYNLDLTNKPSFTTDNDWYSYAVMLFRSLLLVHPYGGTHPTIRTLPERAMKKLTVFDSAVTYPAIALPPEVISEDLGNIFSRYFQRGWRGVFPVEELEKFKNSLIKCSSCSADYPSNRRQCPVCKEQNKAVITTTLPGSVSLRRLAGITGQIVYNKLDGETLILVVVEKGVAVLYMIDLKQVKKIPLFPYEKGMRFEASTKLLVVNSLGKEELEVYEIGEKITFLGKSITDVYSVTQNAVFRVSEKSLFRMIGSNLIQTEFVNGFSLNKSLRPTVDHLSWFAMSSTGPVCFAGFYRVLRQLFFWMYQDGRSIDLAVPQLENGEGLVDLSVKFSSENVLILRKTKKKGEDFILFDLFDKFGRVLCSTRIRAANLPSDHIHGIAFSRGKILFPTDVGAVRYDPMTNEANSFSATAKVINSSHTLYPFGQGLLLVDETSVNYLTLN